MHSDDFNICVFSGGRGTAYIYKSLVGVDGVNLTFIINGYDSGLSTGRVRWAIDGMLGPSDFRKTTSSILIASNNIQDQTIGSILEYRAGDSFYGNDFLSIFSGEERAITWLGKNYPLADIERVSYIISSVNTFLASIEKSEFDFDNFAIGNAVIAGAFIEANKSFNTAISTVTSKLLPKGSPKILNITSGEDLWLAAVTETNHLAIDEGTIASIRPPSAINELLLLNRDVTNHYWSEQHWKKYEYETIEALRSMSVSPKINTQVSEAIVNANIIVYGTGTQHSSILPSYLTTGVRESLIQNTKAEKLLLVNSKRDVDFTLNQDFDQIYELFAKYLGSIEDMKFVTSTYKNIDSWNSQVNGDMDLSEAGTYELLANSLRLSVGLELRASKRIVSVIVPVLNEINRISLVFDQIMQWSPPDGRSVEIIFADGGSTDGTLEWIKEQKYIVLVSHVSSDKTRIASIFKALEVARGEHVVLFHGDNEYQIEDSNRMLALLGASNAPSVVYGSRVHRVSATSLLEEVYGKNRIGFWASRLGGLLTAFVLSLRVGTIISDPFCGYVCANREILKEIFPQSGGIDGIVSSFLSAKKKNISINEVAVSYHPRNKNQGKKTNLMDGVKALLVALTKSSTRA